MPNPSPIEVAFWEAASRRIPNLQREVPIGPFRVDFLVPHKKVVVELYGHAYHGGKEKQTQDAQRERYLQKRGYQVVRFTGQDVYRNVHKCVDDLLAILAAITDSTTTANGSIPKQAGASQLAQPALVPASSPKVAPVGPRFTQRAKTGLRAWQWAVICGLGLAVTIVVGVLALMIVTVGPLTETAPSETPVPTRPPTPAATLIPTPPLLSTDSALRVADCAYYSSSWESVNPGRLTTLTPPTGAVCGIFNFKVSTGETPTIIFNDERYTDLGSCAFGCIVYTRAVPVTIDVQGLTKPGAKWRVTYYWNSGP